MALGILTVIYYLFLNIHYTVICLSKKHVDVVDDARCRGAYQGIADVEKPLLHHEEEKSSRLLVQHLGTQNQWMFCRKMKIPSRPEERRVWLYYDRRIGF